MREREGMRERPTGKKKSIPALENDLGESHLGAVSSDRL